jgi:tRNA (mo5U34)-methyltransferase
MITDAEVREQLRQVSHWRHRIEVRPGLFTPGPDDVVCELDHLEVPVDLRGNRLLDVGASDGGFSFECERRGATVKAIDDESSTLASTGNGFRVAAQILGSAAEYAARSVESLSPESDGTFDRVLFVNVLYHLRNPMLALDRIAAVTTPGGTLHLKTYFRTDVRVRVRGRCVGFDVDSRPKWWFFPGSELGGDPTNWFAPNRRGLSGMLAATGWRDIQELCTRGDRMYYRANRVT